MHAYLYIGSKHIKGCVHDIKYRNAVMLIIIFKV